MRIYRTVQFDTPPLMLASWPGMGNAGIIATDYIRSSLGAKVLAEIDMSPYFIPESIVVEDGLAELPEIPRSIIYYTKDPNLLIFESNAQVSGRDGIAIIKKLVRLAMEYSVPRIYTAAAFAQDVSHTAEPVLLGAFNSVPLIDEFRPLGVRPMPNGYIAGLNGLMLGVAASYNIESVCILGTIPSFAVNLSYPKASLAIIKLIERVVGAKIDCAELEESIALVDTQFSEIESRIRQFYPDAMKQGESEDEKEEWHELVEDDSVDHHTEVPRFIMDRIEKMFAEVADDHSKAPLLKNELDRWNLYELYEHRFLSLFK